MKKTAIITPVFFMFLISSAAYPQDVVDSIRKNFPIAVRILVTTE
jgi:hypothetical protein